MKTQNKKSFKQQSKNTNHQQPYNPLEIKNVIYSEGQYELLHVIEHRKGWSCYAVSFNNEVQFVTLDVEKCFDYLVPKSRGDKQAIDLVNSAKSRLAYTNFKEAQLPRSTYLNYYRFIDNRKLQKDRN